MTTECLVCGQQHEVTVLASGLKIVGCAQMPPDRWFLVSKTPLVASVGARPLRDHTVGDLGVEQVVIARREQVEDVDWSDCSEPVTLR